jgi:uncharacterized protein YprB with RNaseH-like and TPR domain
VNNLTERLIWKQVKTWDDFLARDSLKGFSKPRKSYYNRKIEEAKKNLYTQNSSYFNDKLPAAENWRLYDFFKDEAIFLDIETTGVKSFDDVAVVGLFNGLDTKTMIKGLNLNFYALKQELKKYKLIITFNGATFDVPFLKKRYPDLIPDVPIFDVRTVCARVGLTGGLKEIEKKLGIKRNPIIEKFYGGDPLCLWRMHRATGDEYYLRLLVEYNEEDVINLKKIAEYCISKLKEEIRQKYFELK